MTAKSAYILSKPVFLSPLLRNGGGALCERRVKAESRPNTQQSIVCSQSADAPTSSTSSMAWVWAVNIADMSPGTMCRRILASLDLCIACSLDGEIYALGNKGPPLGVPLTDGTVVEEDVRHSITTLEIFLEAEDSLLLVSLELTLVFWRDFFFVSLCGYVCVYFVDVVKGGPLH